MLFALLYVRNTRLLLLEGVRVEAGSDRHARTGGVPFRGFRRTRRGRRLQVRGKPLASFGELQYVFTGE